jgi:hypothetical protein
MGRSVVRQASQGIAESPSGYRRDAELVTMGRSFQVAWDCADAAAMVSFWTHALHYEVEPPPPGHESWKAYWLSIGIPAEELAPDRDGSDAIVDPEGIGPRIWFQTVPEPKRVKNRLHLDLDVGGGRTVPLEERKERVRAEAARLIETGATRRRVYEEPDVDHYYETLADPEGNEFCIR